MELMNPPKMGGPGKHPFRTGYTHLSFAVGSKEEVDALRPSHPFPYRLTQ